MFSFIIGFILNERSTLHCEIKSFVITVLEVSKGEKLGRITCGHVDMNFAQKHYGRPRLHHYAVDITASLIGQICERFQTIF